MNRTVDITQKFNNGLNTLNQLLAKYGSQGYALAESMLNQPGLPVPASSADCRCPACRINRRNWLWCSGATRRYRKPGRARSAASSAGRSRWANRPPAHWRPKRPRVFRPLPCGRTMPVVRAFRSAPTPRSTARARLVHVAGNRPGSCAEHGIELSDNGKDYVLHYTLGQLPLNIPMRLEVNCMPGARWEGAAPPANNSVAGPTDGRARSR